MRRVLVTGASGAIGRAVSARLMQARIPIRLHGRSEHRIAGALTLGRHSPSYEIMPLDLAQAGPEGCDALVAGCDAVVHCAAMVHRRDASAESYERLNVGSTRMLLAASRAHGVRSFVLLSTLGVYGAGPFEDIDETAPLIPATAYASSKVRCEEALRDETAIRSRVALRIGLVVGEGDRGNVLTLARLIDRGLYFHIAGNIARKSVVCAADVGRIVERCLGALPEGDHVFNVANAESTGVIELADLIAGHLGRRRLPSLPHALVRVAAYMLENALRRRSPVTTGAVRTLTTSTTCSVQKLISRLACPPVVPLVQALEEEIRWARAAGMLRPAA